MPDHSTFSNIRRASFRESDRFRELLETTVLRRLAEGRLVSLPKTAVDKHRSATSSEACDSGDLPRPRRAVGELLHALDEVSCRAASEVRPKFVSGSNPAAQWTVSLKGHIFFAFSANYLIDRDRVVIGAVEAPHPAWWKDDRSVPTMFARTQHCFRHCRRRPAAGSAYFFGEGFAWPAHERGTAYPGLQHIGMPRQPLQSRRLLL